MMFYSCEWRNKSARRGAHLVHRKVDCILKNTTTNILMISVSEIVLVASKRFCFEKSNVLMLLHDERTFD